MTVSTQSIEMLRSGIDCEVYEAFATWHRVTRTALERGVKTVAVQLSQLAGIDGLQPGCALLRATSAVVQSTDSGSA